MRSLVLSPRCSDIKHNVHNAQKGNKDMANRKDKFKKMKLVSRDWTVRYNQKSYIGTEETLDLADYEWTLSANIVVADKLIEEHGFNRPDFDNRAVFIWGEPK